VIYDEIQHALFPDVTYGVESGGDPDVIPKLTYENYLDFHRRYYHPSNSYIYLYGDVDVEERLEWMDREYLSAFDVLDIDSHIDVQKPFGTMKEITCPYSIAAGDDPKGKSYFALAEQCGNYLDPEEGMALEILCEVLVDAPGAPVKQALLDAGIGQDISAFYESDIMQPILGIIAKNVNPEDRDRFKSIVIDTLKKQVEEGISEKSLLATINIREFKYREADYGSSPKGLLYLFDMLRSWLYDDKSAFTRMDGNRMFASLKAKLGTGYYENLIKDKILKNDHALLLTLEPDCGLLDRKNEALKKQLAEYKSSLSAEEVEKIVAETKALRDYQSAEPTDEELTCVPVLERSDIARDANPYVYEEIKIGNVPALTHDINTNGISYVRMFFDVKNLPREMLPYLGFLGAVLGKVDTATHTYRDLTDEIRIHTGGIGFGNDTYAKYGVKDEFRPFYQIRFSAIGREVRTAMELVTEIVTTSKLGDSKRLKEILGEYLSDKQMRYQMSGHAVSIARARSYMSKSALYAEELAGISQYETLKAVMADFDGNKDALSAKLSALVSALFRPENLFVDITGDDAGKTAFAEVLPGFLEKIGAVPAADLGPVTPLIPEMKNEGFMMALGVQYLARCGNIFDAGYKYNGAMRVLSNMMNVDYLYANIRIKGGAYGCGSMILGDSGDVGFWSYRDPNLKETLDVYLGAPDFISGIDIDESEVTRSIIGTFSDLDSPLSASQKISRSLNAYMTGKTFADLQKERNEVLNCTAADLRACADAIRAALAQGYTCALGNEQKIRDNKDIFGNLVSLS
ncbi:MAG: insulinase family protein, partial [Clostridia bacterium]|nr:insulinase family protein [Clostridia bacterium]